MNKTKELMDAAKAARGWTSDYQLSKSTGIPESDLSNYRKGKQHANTYACMRLAIELNLDPAQVIAEVALDREKNPARLEWFRGFLQRAVLRAVLIPALIFTGFYGQDGHAGGIKDGFPLTYSNICA